LNSLGFILISPSINSFFRTWFLQFEFLWGFFRFVFFLFFFFLFDDNGLYFRNGNGLENVLAGGFFILNIFDHLFTKRELLWHLFQKWINWFINCQEDGFGALFWSFDFQKRMLVIRYSLAFFAQVKVLTNCTFITDTNNWTYFATITNILFVNNLLLLRNDLFYLRFLTLQVLFNVFSYVWQHFVDFFLDNVLNKNSSALFSKFFAMTESAFLFVIF